MAEIGGAARLEVGPLTGTRVVPDHAAALALVFEAMEEAGLAVASLKAVAHRVVHGGAALVAPCRVTDAVMDAVHACVPLAVEFLQRSMRADGSWPIDTNLATWGTTLSRHDRK